MRDPQLGRIATFLDNVIATVSPRRAFMRRAARFAAENAFSYSGRGGYSGGKTKRTTADWLPGGGSADADILFDLEKLRDRSRDLVRNNAHAHGIVATFESNVIGTGIKPQSTIQGDRLGIDDDGAESMRRLAETVFERWVPEAEATGRLDFVELQTVAFRQMLENGDAFLLRRMIDEPKTRRFSFAWELVEADRVDTPNGVEVSGNVRSGIELSENGTPIAYHIRRTHPGDYPVSGTMRTNRDAEFVRVPAYDDDGRPNVIHLYKADRPGQTRGVPLLAPILPLFRHLNGYVEGKVMAARITSAICLWIETPDAVNAAATRASGTDPTGKAKEGIQPGKINYLSPGQKINAFNPSVPATDFEMFVNSIVRMMSSSVGLSYELTSKDYSKTNYSSARASLQQSYRMFRSLQSWISRRLCDPSWRLVMEEAILRGMFPAGPDFARRFDDLAAVRWISPGWEWIDPLKEAQASKIAVEYGFSSTVDENVSRGKDIDATLEEEARVAAKRRELGLRDPYANGSSSNSEPIEVEDDEDEERDEERRSE